MGFFRKSDPISEQSRELNAKIAELDAEVKKLQSRLEHAKKQSARPEAVPLGNPPFQAKPVSAPVFEPVNQSRLKAVPEPPSPPRFNDLGVRKYDLPALVRRCKKQFKHEPANPKLVKLLAAGNIQGPRPLRYETRVARNRCIFLAVVFLLLVWGLLAMFLRI